MASTTTFELHIHPQPSPCASSSSSSSSSSTSSSYTLHVRWYSSIKDVKDMLKQLTGVAPNRLFLFRPSSSVPLSHTLTLHDLGIDGREGGHNHLRLSILSPRSGHAGNSYYVLHAASPVVEDPCARMLADVTRGLQRHQAPAKTDVLDCTGGVYFMRAPGGAKTAVFKPEDEEQGMPNNPKGYKGNGSHGLRPHFKPGYGCMREVAAYLMDVDSFSGVPPTLLVHCEHPVLNYPARGTGQQGAIFGPSMFPKLGSLQHFVRASDVFEDLGPSVLSDLEVQKIALLDIRLLNCDRNASNILAIQKVCPPGATGSSSGSSGNGMLRSREGSLTDDVESPDREISFDDLMAPPCSSSSSSSSSGYGGSGGGERADRYHLVPIDHGYSLPSKLLINEIDWAWFYYPQVARPVHEDVKKYVRSLDIDTLVARLQQQVTLTDDALFLVRVAHHLVADGIDAGLTLHDLALLVARTDEERPSPLERAIAEAEENAHRTIEMRVGALARAAASPVTAPDEWLSSSAAAAAAAAAGAAAGEDVSISPGGTLWESLLPVARGGSEKAYSSSSSSGRAGSIGSGGDADTPPSRGRRPPPALDTTALDTTTLSPAALSAATAAAAAGAGGGAAIGPPLKHAGRSPLTLARVSSSPVGGDLRPTSPLFSAYASRSPVPPQLQLAEGAAAGSRGGGQDEGRYSSMSPANTDSSAGSSPCSVEDYDTAAAAAALSLDDATSPSPAPAPAADAVATSSGRGAEGKGLQSVMTGRRGAEREGVYDSTDSEHSSLGSESRDGHLAALASAPAVTAAPAPAPAQPPAGAASGSDTPQATHQPKDAPKGSLASASAYGSACVLVAPSPVRMGAAGSQGLVRQASVSFQNLSDALPKKRPSPLQVGSADPFKRVQSAGPGQSPPNTGAAARGGAARRGSEGAAKGRATENADADAGADGGGEGVVPAHPPAPPAQPSPSSAAWQLQPPSFMRVTSFSAFSSAPLYDAAGAERRVAKLRRERRRRAEGSEEFHRLRSMYVRAAVTTLIAKAAKSRALK